MQDNDEITPIFKKLDVGSALELAVIIAAAALLIIAAQSALPWIANRLHGTKRLHLLAVIPLIRLLIILTALALIVPLLIEPSIQNIVTILGAVGLALGFALKDYVSSLIAGIVAIGEKPYRNGDWIEIDGVYGEVRNVGMRTVKVVTPDDTVVAIPHARLWTDPIFNANDGVPRLQCIADFYLHPQHDTARARLALRDVALTSPYLHFNEPIAVIVQEKPWGTHYQLKAYPVEASQQFRFISDLTVRGKAALCDLGASFAIAPTVPEKQARRKK
ncbi:MAG: mechanosensitive ion channel family protein [Gammaproteobacteria bacterium]